MFKSKNKIDKKVKYGKLNIYISISVLLSTLIFIIIFKTNYFTISEIIIKNNEKLSRDDIIAYSGIKVENNIFQIKLSQVEKKLQENPYIKEAKVSRSIPDKIIIEITERRKLAAIYYTGIYFIIDDEGYVLEAKTDVDDVVVVDGFEIDSFVEGKKINLNINEDLTKVLNLCKLLQKSSIDINPKISYNNGNINLVINEKFKVKFGNGENIDYKFRTFLTIFQYLKSKDIYSGVIDISSKGYPIYRPFEE